MLNKLLERQLKRYLKSAPDLPADVHALLKAISDSYDHYESNRILIERSLDISSQELTEANDKVMEAYRQIEEKNRNILDSINYAKRIQEALLPPQSEIYSHLKHAFVLYQPKDIVSGDFYWFAARPQCSIIALVDCTGHGVPGALMSIVGSQLLDEIVNQKGVTQPSEVLRLLDVAVVHSMKQGHVEGELHSQDGMDVALCRIDHDKKEIVFSSANRRLIHISKKRLVEIKGDKYPIGGNHDHKKVFKDHVVVPQSEDAFYIFSDGFADQFGGPEGKKFMMKQMKDLLLEIHELPMNQQEKTMGRVLGEWRGQREQVDDVCVIGFRI